MPTNEDLFREIQEKDAADDARYRQALGGRELAKVKRKPVDPRSARQRYEEEIKPVLETRARIRSGLPPTRNPLVNLLLKIKGQDKLPELPKDQIIEPSKGLVIDGPTIAEAQKAIADNPEAFRDLAKAPADSRKVDAKRREPGDLRHD